MKDWIEQGREAARRLLQTSDLLSGSPVGMAEGLRAFAQAEAAALPFVEGAPGRLENLRSELSAVLAGSGLDIPVVELLGDRESEAAREIRNLYRIAWTIVREPEAKDLVVDLSPMKASRALTANFPDIAVDLTAHLQEFGWVRTAGTELDLLSEKEALQRIQVALLRWNEETIALAADPPPARRPEPPAAIQDLTGDYRSISDDPSFTPGLSVKAKWLARLFFGQVASAVNRPLSEVLNHPAQVLLEAVEGGKSLPGIAPATTVTGAAVSLGRAAGRVRIVLDADEGGKVQVGDIIVTNLSTPTYEGQPSIFPYRTVPSVPIEKAAAIVTDEGGLLSHAAIICRENSVPSLLGAEGASQMLEDGMIVEVDATRANGQVTVLAG